MEIKDKKSHLLVISRIPAPYREILFDKIHNKGEIKLKVIYQYSGREGTAWSKNKKDLGKKLTYKNEALIEYPCGKFKELLTLIPCICRIKKAKPDLIIIHGYNFTASWSAMLVCWVFRISYALRSDSNGYIQKKKTIKSVLKQLFLKKLVSNANSIFFIGSANQLFWRKLGATEKQLIEARYAVDESIFSSSKNLDRKIQKTSFLFVGRLIKRKRTIDLIHSFIRMVDDFKVDNCYLTIVGVGPELEPIQNLVSNWNKENIRLIGQCTPAEMPSLYRKHDVLICPYIDEPWGLTINEAMSCGLAIIAEISGSCGAAVDLLKNRLNGIGINKVTINNLVDRDLNAVKSLPKTNIFAGNKSNQILKAPTI